MNTQSTQRMRIGKFIGIGLLLVAAIVMWRILQPVNGGDAAHPLATPQPPSGNPPASISKGGSSTVSNTTQDQEAPPSDFESLLARYSPEQQRILKAFYSGYSGTMMQFSTPEQLAWLKRRGFPMPEDVLAAQFLSDEALASRAEAGDSKAAAFLAERRIHQVGPHPDRHHSASAVVNVWRLEPDVISSGSPFGGYFHARLKNYVATMEHPDDPQAVERLSARARVIGYEWSFLLGDTRVSGLSKTMQDTMYNYSQIASSSGKFDDTFSAMREFRGLLGIALRHNPDLFLNRRDMWPKSPDG